MSSSNNREQSSPPNLYEQPPPSYSSVVRYSGLEPIHHLQSMETVANWTDLESDPQRSTAIQAVQLANQLQQLQVNGDLNTASAHGANVEMSRHTNSPRNDSLAEDELTEQLKHVINAFMTRPGRRYSYDTTISWAVDHGNHINYSVVILINQPSALI